MSQILVDTAKLRSYADRLSSVNKRLKKLQRRIDSLSYLVTDETIRSMAKTDSITDYCWKVSCCQNYLNQTATDFDKAERNIYDNTPFTPNLNSLFGFMATGVAENGVKHSSPSNKSLFAKFVNNGLKKSGSVLSGETSSSGDFLGINTAGKAKGSLLTGEVGFKNGSKFSFKDEDGNFSFDDFGLNIEAYATGSLAEGEVEGNIGYLHGKLSGKAGTGTVKGESKFCLFQDGKFNPALLIGAAAEVSALHGEAEVGFGNDQYGIYGKAEGDLLHAEAEANAGVGYMGKDKDGKDIYGVGAKASAMASVAQGEVKGGFTLFGIDIDVGVEGYAVAAGVEAGCSVSTKGVKTKFAGALGLGAGVEVSVDWSDAEWVGETIDAVGDAAKAVGDFAGDAAKAVGDFAGDAAKAVGDFTGNAVDAVGDFFGWF